MEGEREKRLEETHTPTHTQTLQRHARPKALGVQATMQRGTRGVAAEEEGQEAAHILA